MPQDQMFLMILGVVVLAFGLHRADLPLRTRRRRPAWGHQRRWGWPGRSVTRSARSQASAPSGSALGRTGGGDARTAAAIEAFVAGVSTGAAGLARPPNARQALPGSREPVAGATPATSAIELVATMDGEDADGREPSPMPVPRSPIQASDWTPAGVADPSTWERAVREESLRAARVARPVTVVMAELPHLDDVAHRLGREIADRVVTETARLLVSEGDATDRIAWLGDGRFGVLLLETEEIRTSDYVGRVRAAADGWLESAGLSIRLSLGWAGPAEGVDVIAAAATAQQRMQEAAERTESSRELLLTQA